MKIVDIRATTIAMPLEAPLRRAGGAHWGRFIRTIVEVVTVSRPFLSRLVLTVRMRSGTPSIPLAISASTSLSRSAMPVRGGSRRSQAPKPGSLSSVVVQVSTTVSTAEDCPIPITRISMV